MGRDLSGREGDEGRAAGECPHCGEVGNPKCRAKCMAERARMIVVGTNDVLRALTDPENAVVDPTGYLKRLRRYAGEIAAFLGPSAGDRKGAS